jgi:hypothetical protein
MAPRSVGRALRLFILVARQITKAVQFIDHPPPRGFGHHDLFTEEGDVTA